MDEINETKIADGLKLHDPANYRLTSVDNAPWRWVNSPPELGYKLRNQIAAAKAGNVDMQINLGLSYAQGAGIPQDFKMAARYFRMAARQGDYRAIHNLGVLYLEAADAGMLADTPDAPLDAMAE